MRIFHVLFIILTKISNHNLKTSLESEINMLLKIEHLKKKETKFYLIYESLKSEKIYKTSSKRPQFLGLILFVIMNRLLQEMNFVKIGTCLTTIQRFIISYLFEV